MKWIYTEIRNSQHTPWVSITLGHHGNSSQHTDCIWKWGIICITTAYDSCKASGITWQLYLPSCWVVSFTVCWVGPRGIIPNWQTAFNMCCVTGGGGWHCLANPSWRICHWCSSSGAWQMSLQAPIDLQEYGVCVYLWSDVWSDVSLASCRDN